MIQNIWKFLSLKMDRFLPSGGVPSFFLSFFLQTGLPCLVVLCKCRYLQTARAMSVTTTTPPFSISSILLSRSLWSRALNLQYFWLWRLRIMTFVSRRLLTTSDYRNCCNYCHIFEVIKSVIVIILENCNHCDYHHICDLWYL